MFQIRIHGRGGQGVVTGAEMLSIAAFEQAAMRRPSELRLGAHRRAGGGLLPHRRARDPPARAGDGARRADHPGPDAAAPGRRLPGPEARGLRADQLGAQLRRTGRRRIRAALPARAPVNVPAGEIAKAHLGRPLPNAALLGGFAAISGLITLEAVARPSATSSRRASPRRNIAAASRGLRTCASRNAELAHAQGRLKARAPSPRRWRCARPEVICAYPISPQTHIVEALGELVKSGALSPASSSTSRASSPR